jgi:hypothetical protein
VDSLERASQLATAVSRWVNAIIHRPDLRLPLLVVLSFGGGAALLKTLPKEFGFRPEVTVLAYVLFVIALGSLLALALRVRHRAMPTEIKPSGPTAIMGSMPFGPSDQDGDLYQQLGRDRELSLLVHYVQDDLIPIVIVQGPSGVGKTSLLRSGLQYRLRHEEWFKPPIPCAYWEALPIDPGPALLHALRAALPGDAPRTLDDFVNQEGPHRVVIVDKLEQLDPRNPAHAPVFNLLLADAGRPTPHRTTWILAFRDSFSSVWFSIASRHPELRVQRLLLDALTEKQARDAMATIAHRDGILLDDRIINDFVKGTVLPVQVGIAMSVLSDLRKRLEKNELRFDDYRNAGGSETLLTLYLQNHLIDLDAAERQAVFRSLLELVDQEKEPPQRAPEGRALERLAAAANLPQTAMQFYLKILVEARVLDKTEPEVFRLQHDLFVPTIIDLNASLLSEVRQGELLLLQYYSRWQQSSSDRDLLRTTDLPLAAKYIERARARERKSALTEAQTRFWKRSWRYRMRRLSLGALFLLAPLGLFSYYRYSRTEHYKALLASWQLPVDLYSAQTSLDSLMLPRAVDRVDWLAANIHSLRLHRIPRHDASDRRARFDELPDHLLFLDISNLAPSIPNGTRSDGLVNIDGLPRRLEYLNINDNDLLSRLDDLPPSLRSLAATSKGLADFTGLPSSLRCLEVGSPQFGLESLEFLRLKLTHLSSLRLTATRLSALHGLPDSLRVLGLFFNAQLQSPRALDDLPPQLSALAVDFYPHRPELDHLPVALKELHLSRVILPRFETTARLPEGLRALALHDVRFSGDRVDKGVDEWRFLPASLQFLSLAGTTPLPSSLPPALAGLSVSLLSEGDLPWQPLPPHLTMLRLAYVRLHAGELEALPRSLTDLAITHAPLEHLTGCPVGVSHLDLRWTRRLKDILGLPPKLEALNLLYSVDLERLDNLPATLRYLNLAGTHLARLPALPPSLEELDISGTRIASLDGLPLKLRTLTLSPGQVRTLHGLPLSVRELRFVDSPEDRAEISFFSCGSAGLSEVWPGAGLGRELTLVTR